MFLAAQILKGAIALPGGGNPESVAAIIRQLRSKILNNLEHGEEFAFLRNSPEHEQLRPLLEE